MVYASRCFYFNNLIILNHEPKDFMESGFGPLNTWNIEMKSSKVCKMHLFYMSPFLGGHF